MSKKNKGSVVNASNEPVQCFGFYANLSATVEQKIGDFLKRFGVSADVLDEYQPLFLVNNQSSSGEIAGSFGLFVKDNVLFEVNGTECSVWDFDGQWEPEQTSVAILLHRLDKGALGKEGFEEDHFDQQLRALLLRISQPTASSKFKR